MSEETKNVIEEKNMDSEVEKKVSEETAAAVEENKEETTVKEELNVEPEIKTDNIEEDVFIEDTEEECEETNCSGLKKAVVAVTVAAVIGTVTAVALKILKKKK